MREGLAGLGEDEVALRSLVTGYLAFALVFAPGDEAHRLAVEAVALARAADDDEALAESLGSLAWTERASVPIAQRSTTVTELLEVAERSGDRGRVALAQLQVGRVRLDGGDLDGADAAFEASCSIPGMTLEGWTIRNYRAARLEAEGRFAEADAVTESAHSIGNDAGETSDAVLHAQRFRTAYDRGDAERCAELAVSLASTPFARLAPYDALIAEITGDEEQMRTRFETWFDEVRPQLPAHLAYVGTAYVTSMIQRLGDAERAAQCLGPVQLLSGELPGSEVVIYESFDTCAARLLSTLGRVDEAIAAGEAGDALHRRIGLDARTAVSSTDLGAVLLGRDAPGDRERCEEFLRDGADLAERLGMAPTLARARALLG